MLGSPSEFVREQCNTMSTSPVKQPPSPFKRQNSLPKTSNSIPKRSNSMPRRQNSMSPMKRRENASPFTVSDEDLAPRRGNWGIAVILQMVNISMLLFCAYRLQFIPSNANPGASDADGTKPMYTDDMKLGVSFSSWDIAAATNLNYKPYVAPVHASCGLDVVGRVTAKTGPVPTTWPLCANHVPRNATVYSFGLGADVAFDVQMSRRGHRVFAFDPAVTAERAGTLFTAGADSTGVRTISSFMQVGLGDKNGVVPFGGVAEEGVLEAPVMTLQTLMAALGHDHIDLLKVGAGGAEPGICQSPAFLEALAKVGQVLLNFQGNEAVNGQCVASLKGRGFRHLETDTAAQHAFVRMTAGGKVAKSLLRSFLR